MATSGFDAFSQQLAALSPQQRQQILGLGTWDDRHQRLMEQLQQAQALRQDPGQHSTGLGEALGGLGSVLSTVNSGLQSKALNAKLDALVGQRQQGRDAYAQAIVDALRRRQADRFGAITAPGGGVIAPIPGGGQ
jgi:hypothetical protein